MSYLNKYNILSDQQFGFRKSKSTEDAILELTTLIADRTDKGKKCLAVFLDLKKAFDTVSLPTLIRKMERAGIRGNPLNLLSDYLQGRTQRVKIDDFVSQEADITFGVPQGSVLGPTLFLLYINDLTNLKIQRGRILCYADDTVIVFEGPSWESVFESAEIGLSSVYSWLKRNLLTLNLNKTNYICFAKYNSSQPKNHLTLKIHKCNTSDRPSCNCMAIDKVYSMKYLGIMLDQRMSWYTHTEYVNKRIRKLIWLFKKLRHITTKKLLNQLYVTLAQSVMSYCITVWGGSAKTKFLEVERGQRCLLKVMYSKPYRFPTEELYHLSDLLSMRKLYVLSITTRLHKTLTFNSSHLNRRQKHNVAALSTAKSVFARRQFAAQSASVYNKINKMLNIYHLQGYKCKKIIIEWLKKLNYEETEALLY